MALKWWTVRRMVKVAMVLAKLTLGLLFWLTAKMLEK